MVLKFYFTQKQLCEVFFPCVPQASAKLTPPLTPVYIIHIMILCVVLFSEYFPSRLPIPTIVHLSTDYR